MAPYRRYIEAALQYAGNTHTYEDVEGMVAAGRAQFWPGPAACVITQIDHQPQHSILHFFLAAGNLAEIEAMAPGLLEWGKAQGCTRARFVGRRGWERTFLARTGWEKTDVVVMEKSLNG